jgi:hypothetical protein
MRRMSKHGRRSIFRIIQRLSYEGLSRFFYYYPLKSILTALSLFLAHTSSATNAVYTKILFDWYFYA